MPKQQTVMDWINQYMASGDKPISLEEWTYIRNNGTPEEIAEAAERMAAAGGYENLV